ncbi:hypothetical protein [Marinobacter sp. F3R08]|uniref:hypothetical protein n=1 Tax=Marinobacter sp. F3R08 TaxID=2841559 RepID=UPI001C086C9C|nr:hypothetical protein [Marinobacter sp. F3R08]MBU2952262.1 hypothetical protein [Marinobacter sp. F3R08]
MNIYQMYVEHWRQPGFWVRRTTWGNTIAKIISVGELSGRAPYYGNPEVIAIVYDINTGEVKDEHFIIDTAGTYKTWRWVQPPEWSGETDFDPSNGRVLLYIPFGENKRASSMGARWSELLQAWWIPEADEKLLAKAAERGYLSLPEARIHFDVGFENKNVAKEAGGIFHSDTKTWSFGESDTKAIEKMKAKGFIERDSQNNSE